MTEIAPLIALAILILAAKLGGEIVLRLGQPAVLGELAAGIALGQIAGLKALHTHPAIEAVAEIGAILLLFEVGLELDLGKMLAVGRSSLLVACLGVAAPMVLGYGVACC
jgi:Kef-type K+ transport system membrane component KefB